MKLALNVIAKDEKEQLQRIINDYSPYFDEIVITYDFDTAIQGLEISEKVKLVKYEWRNDFSHKRNFTAENTESEFYLRIDTDDIIENPQKIREVFENCVKLGFDVVYFPYVYSRDKDGNCDAQHWRESIIRKRKDIYWKKAIHENIFVEDQKKFKGMKYSDIRIIHDITPEHAEESAERNLKYLLEEFEKDKEETDPRTLSYIGRVFHGKKEWKKAVPFMERLIEKSGWDDDKYFAWVYLSDCWQNLGNLEQAIGCCYEALSLNTTFPDAYIKLGGIWLSKGEYQKALDWIMPGLVRPIPDTMFVVDPSVYKVTAKMFACLAFIGKGDFENAQIYFNELTNIAPSSEFIRNRGKEIGELISDALFNKRVIDFSKELQVRSGKLETFFDSLPKSTLKDDRIWALKNLYSKPKKWGDKSVVIYCGWAWIDEWADPSVISGVGGSEEAVIYLSRELAKLGWEVTVFNSCGEMAGVYNGVIYRNSCEFSPNDEYNIVISWRCNIFNGKIKARKKLVWLHDVPAVGQFDGEEQFFDKLIVLSEFHKSLIPNELPKEKVFVSSNGINIPDFKPSGIRNPFRMIYTSSYDRGIGWLLTKWPEIKKEVPEAELHLFYGWHVWMEMEKRGVRKPEIRLTLTKLMNQPGIFEHGRVGHKELIKEFNKSGIYVYPSSFEEISCISAMKAQACGCVAVTTDYAALNETVKSGIKIPGRGDDKKTIDSFTETLISLLKNPEKQEELRKQTEGLKEVFGWNKVAQVWHKDLFV